MILKGFLAFTASGLPYEHFTTLQRHGYYNTLKTLILCREASPRRRTSIWNNTTIKYKQKKKEMMKRHVNYAVKLSKQKIIEKDLEPRALG